MKEYKYKGRLTKEVRKVGKANRRIHGYSFGIHFKAENVADVQSAILSKYPQMKMAMRRALSDAAIGIRKESEQLCPKDTGYLRSSSFIVRGHENGKVSLSEHTLVSNEITRKRRYRKRQAQINSELRFVKEMEKKGLPAVSVGYSANHFLFVHEINPKPNGYKVGQWKFLEQAYVNKMPRTMARMRKETHDAWLNKGLYKRSYKIKQPKLVSGEKLGF